MAKLAYHFEAGGWAMWLILVCLVFAIGFTIERAMYLYKASIDKDEFIAKMQKCITAGDVAGAIKIMELNLEFNPDAPVSHLLLGQLYQASGDTDAAVASVKKSLELDPQNKWAQKMLEQLQAVE